MLLLRKKKQSITYAQHDKRRAGIEGEIFTELLWDSQLTFFTNLSGRQILDCRIVRCHRECLVGISCHGESGYFNSSFINPVQHLRQKVDYLPLLLEGHCFRQVDVNECRADQHGLEVITGDIADQPRSFRCRYHRVA